MATSTVPILSVISAGACGSKKKAAAVERKSLRVGWPSGCISLRDAERNPIRVSRRFAEERHDHTQVAHVATFGQVAALHLEIEANSPTRGQFGEAAAEFQRFRAGTGYAPRGTALYAARHAHPAASFQQRRGDLESQGKFRHSAAERGRHLQAECLGGPAPGIVLRRVSAA